MTTGSRPSTGAIGLLLEVLIVRAVSLVSDVGNQVDCAVDTPYPSAETVWARAASPIGPYETFNDLMASDMIHTGRAISRRSLGSLRNPTNGQTAFLARGVRPLPLVEQGDLTIDDAIGYSAVVGVMALSEIERVDDCVVDQDYKVNLLFSRSLASANNQFVGPRIGDVGR